MIGSPTAIGAIGMDRYRLIFCDGVWIFSRA